MFASGIYGIDIEQRRRQKRQQIDPQAATCKKGLRQLDADDGDHLAPQFCDRRLFHHR